jgi:hypothetical protein
MSMVTTGADYTFGFGNGLYFSAEHMSVVWAQDFLASDEDVQISAHLLRYPISLMDNLTFIGYYVWEQNAYLPHLNWGRTYDTTMININLFHVPDVDMESKDLFRAATSEGTGIEFMITFNH